MKTNTILPTINILEFEAKYDVFRLQTDDKYIPSSAKLFDLPEMQTRICSVLQRQEEYRYLYVLMEKASDNKSTLLQTIKNCGGGEKISVSSNFSISKCDKIILIQLLLNALHNFKKASLHFLNLSGHLYIFKSEWSTNLERNVVSLEIQINKYSGLELNVRTFSNIKDCPQKNVLKYPHFVRTSKNTLRRKLHDDKDLTTYILHQSKNKKSTIDFFSIKDHESFKKSKMGILAQIIIDFNEKYNGIACLDFETIDTYDSIELSATEKKLKSTIHSHFAKQDIIIIDAIASDESKAYCGEIKNLLLTRYSLPSDKIKIGKRYKKGALHLRVIHNASYYENTQIEDVYNSLPNKDFVVQHITIEDFENGGNAALETVICEMLIKQDLMNNHINLIDWKNLGYKEPFDFITRFSKDGTDNLYMVMHILPNGDFSIKQKAFDLFTQDEYNHLMQIFEDDGNVEGVVQFADGGINAIHRTGKFTIPEILNIKEELSKGNNKLRGKNARERLFDSIIDIKFFNQNDNCYYCVGTIGAGMRQDIPRSSIIRKIVSVGTTSIRFSELLSLMNVTFIRGGQLTVLPFPFKYLREYIKRL